MIYGALVNICKHIKTLANIVLAETESTKANSDTI
jgi:hypothetical protein